MAVLPLYIPYTVFMVALLLYFVHYVHGYMKSVPLGEVQISLHKIMHVDWFRFFALRHDDEAREMLAEIADNCGSEEERQLAR